MIIKSADPENGKKRTCPITFRLPEKLIDDLKGEATGGKVSLNTLANQVFERYMAWDRHGAKIGLIPMTRPFLKETLQQLPEAKIRQIAHNASKDALKELVLIMTGDFTLESFISAFNEWLKVAWMIHRYEYDGNGHRYVIYHGLGRKWSLYLSELLFAICKDLVRIEPQIEVRKDSISFYVSKSPLNEEEDLIRVDQPKSKN